LTFSIDLGDVDIDRKLALDIDPLEGVGVGVGVDGAFGDGVGVLNTRIILSRFDFSVSIAF
jgi:hypothetical protein